MSKRLYVGNLPYSSTAEDLRAAFEPHGTVLDVKVVMDRDTGRPRGFAFVEMDDAGAESAIETLDQSEFGGRMLVVNIARERERPGYGASRDRKW